MRVLTCLVLAGLACGGPSALSLAATPSALAGDGESPVTLVATATRAGLPAEGIAVHFVASLGAFQGSVAGSPRSAGATTDADGKAAVTLLAPRQGRGQVAITASASLDGHESRATAEVPLVPAGGLADSLGFRCSRQNIGAFVTGRAAPIEVLCTATAKRGTAVLPKASVETLAEAGALEWVTGQTGEQQLVYGVPVDAPPPKDVDPFDDRGTPQAACPAGCTATAGGAYDANLCPGEPCWLDPTGVTHNPRDGVATLVAAVPSRSADGQGEPYLDANDNGVHDSNEPYLDFNGNGKWDGPDGQIKDRLLWRSFRIVWSGEADRSATGHSSSMRFDGPSATVYLHDRNFNALAAAGPAGADRVEVQAGDCTGDGTLAISPVPGFVLEQTDPGIAFSADTGAIQAPGLHSTYLRKTDYGFSGSLAGSVAHQQCAVSLTAHRQYDPGDPSGSIDTEVLQGAFSF